METGAQIRIAIKKLVMKNKRNKQLYGALLLGLMICGPAFAQKKNIRKEENTLNEFYYWVYSHPEVKAQSLKTGMEAMTAPDRLPYLFPPGVQTKQFSSHDVNGANGDGDFERAFTRYIDSNGENVIFDEYGPGCLYRQQMNIWMAKKLNFYPGAGQARIRYYFDDENQPRINCTIDELFSTIKSPLNPSLNFTDHVKRFAVSYSPLPFRKRLKITVTPATDWSGREFAQTWYQYTYHSYPEDFSTASWKPGISENTTLKKQWNSLGQDPKDTTGQTVLNFDRAIKDGDSAVITLDRPGSIGALKIRLSPYNVRTFYDVQVKIYWDDQRVPAVDAPLGHFFGGGAREFFLDMLDIPARSLKTLFYGYDASEHSFYSYWPMPFWKNARIVFVNKAKIDIDHLVCTIGFKPESVYAYPKEGTGYFCAKRTFDKNWANKPYATAFREEGRGHVTGISFYSDEFNMDGDEFTYIDGSHTPQIHGDGTEDDHNQGFGGSNYQKPLWGGLLNGYQGGYRIYFNDAYVFNNGIDIRYEHETWPNRAGKGGSPNARTDVLVYYYRSAVNTTLKLTDSLNVGNGISEEKTCLPGKRTSRGRHRFKQL